MMSFVEWLRFLENHIVLGNDDCLLFSSKMFGIDGKLITDSKGVAVPLISI